MATKSGSGSAARGSRKSSTRKTTSPGVRKTSGRSTQGAGRSTARQSTPAAKQSQRSASESSARGTGGRSGGGRGRVEAAGRGAPGASRGKGRSGSGRAQAPLDALKLLKQDHDTVDQMFKRYERMKEGDERKAALREQICDELRVHAQVEEEIFYPALKSLFEAGDKEKDVDLIEEADVEHASLKWLIEQLESGDQGDEGATDAKVKVLGEYVRHHVKEEEGPIFRGAKRVDIDLEDLGARMDARKRELKGELPANEDDDALRTEEPAEMASGSRGR